MQRCPKCNVDLTGHDHVCGQLDFSPRLAVPLRTEAEAIAAHMRRDAKTVSVRERNQRIAAARYLRFAAPLD